MNKFILYTLAILCCIASVYANTDVVSDKQTDIKDKPLNVAIDGNFVGAFLASFSVILLSEIGDKTFFIAAIMAMSNGRKIIFSSAILALAIMTVLSVFIGMTLPALVPRQWTHIASCILFVVFGFKLLVDAYCDDGSVIDEMHEVEEELAQHNAEASGLTSGTETDVELQTLNNRSNGKPKAKSGGIISTFFPAVAWQCFSLTFLAEWGDRSQISTIALAASRDPIGVCIGGILGHAICTGIAVLSGKALAYRISERMMHLIGGCLFLIFAVTGIMFGAD